MQNPALAEISAKKSVSGFPLVGAITNTNTLLGQNGIVGIKTGHSDEAGGAYVAAARATINGQTATVVTALLAAPSIDDARAASLTLLRSIEAKNFKPNELCGGISPKT
jgi:D-alanyl-D-alanine carboxypeptidase (penicillin-binding protein 5/6)